MEKKKYNEMFNKYTLHHIGHLFISDFLEIMKQMLHYFKKDRDNYLQEDFYTHSISSTLRTRSTDSLLHSISAAFIGNRLLVNLTSIDWTFLARASSLSLYPIVRGLRLSPG